MGNWWKNGEVLIIDNHCAPSHSEGVWKIRIDRLLKADKEYKERLVQATFLSEWQGGTVRDMTCKRCLWPGVAPSHKPCEQYIHWVENWVTFLARISSDCTLHVFANLYLLAYCSSISLAPITHFLLNLLTRSSCIAYYPQLTLSRTLDLVHCTFSSARIWGSG